MTREDYLKKYPAVVWRLGIGKQTDVVQDQDPIQTAKHQAEQSADLDKLIESEVNEWSKEQWRIDATTKQLIQLGEMNINQSREITRLKAQLQKLKEGRDKLKAIVEDVDYNLGGASLYVPESELEKLKNVIEANPLLGELEAKQSIIESLNSQLQKLKAEIKEHFKLSYKGNIRIPNHKFIPFDKVPEITKILSYES